MDLTLDALLRECVDRDASDLHVKSDSKPLLRRYGDLSPIEEFPVIPAAQARELAYSVLEEWQIEQFERDWELDVAYEIPGIARFRGNVLVQRGRVGSVWRVIPYKISTMEELGLPPACRYLSERPRGLVLVTGPAGSGKSTTQSAMINYINESFEHHVVTVEDPVEFVHEDKKALVNQRELNRDTRSFANALKYVLRQDPDVILIGEMRDLETIGLAITAAETGHLVFGTLHTQDAVQTIDRVIDVFPTHQQAQVRIQMASNLLGVISQTLVKRADGKGRIAAYEVMLAVPAVRNMIRESKTHQIHSVLQTATKQGMMTLDQSLAGLVKRKLITYEDAYEKTTNPSAFATLVGEGGGVIGAQQ